MSANRIVFRRAVAARGGAYLLAHLDEALALDPRGHGEEAHDCNKQTELLLGVSLL
jgi:hypothetical protein